MTIHSQLNNLLKQTIHSICENGLLANTNLDISSVKVETSRDPNHGDFTTNFAMTIAKAAQKSPREIAQAIKDHFPESELIAQIEIAGPGFINFTLTSKSYMHLVQDILESKDQFGRVKIGENKKIHIEYVSANPTGPLHVGHGRSAAYGACLANILEACGYSVHREYYVNDVGRQMRILALSTWIRYLQLAGQVIELPENAYQGEYVIDTATQLQTEYGTLFCPSAADFSRLQLPQLIKTDKESHIDAYIELAIQLIGSENFELIRQTALQGILNDIKQDLQEFGVTYDNWFHESELLHLQLIDAGINLLRDHGHVYERDGATWFRATDFGDEKDRVLIRENGQSTYFASDVAYHLYKYNQNFDHIIDIFGADHHGYIARICAFLKGLGKNPALLKVLLVQFVILYRDKEKVSMSTRSGEFVTLRALRQEVGNDVARFFYIMRKPEQHLDFDLTLAKQESNENPVYYIQYAYARICSVWRQLAKEGEAINPVEGLAHFDLLSTHYEKQLLHSLLRYPEQILHAALKYEPHVIAHYLQELANLFHSYYNAEKFLVSESNLRNARLCLILSVQQILSNGLRLLGLTTPEVM